MRRLLVMLCAVLALAIPVTASSAGPRGPAARGAAADELRAALDRVVDAGAPGAVGAVESATATTTAASGLADTRTGQPMAPELRFRAGSVTKTLVATVVLQLVGEGKLALDDPVARWLPDLLPNGDRVTVRQLLNHTSGIPDYVDLVLPEDLSTPPEAQPARFRVWAPEELVRQALTKPPLFEPGAPGRWSYSNTNYIVVGLLVERVTGKPLERELRERVFWPADLEDTDFPVDSPFISRPRSRGYSTARRDGTGELVELTALHPSAAWAAGALVSDADDLARFYRALLGGRLLKAQQLAEMKQTVPAGFGLGYGLGLFEIPLGGDCGTLWGHNGAIPGFQTYALSTADGGRQVAITANLYAAPDPVTSAVLFGALGQACGQAQASKAVEGLERLARITG